MSKYIDADRLRAEIDKRMTENCKLAEKCELVRTSEVFGNRASEDNDILAIIDSLQQELPDGVTHVNLAAEKYADSIEGQEAFSYGADHYCWGDVNDAFLAGATWMAGQGVTLKVTDDTTWGEVNDFIHRNCDGVKEIQIRKKEESK